MKTGRDSTFCKMDCKDSKEKGVNLGIKEFENGSTTNDVSENRLVKEHHPETK